MITLRELKAQIDIIPENLLDSRVIIYGAEGGYNDITVGLDPINIVLDQNEMCWYGDHDHIKYHGEIDTNGDIIPGSYHGPFVLAINIQ